MQQIMQSDNRRAYIIPFIILCEGFVSVSLEITSIRQLLPVVGGSIIVTSLIIGIFLLFLALGYQKGGRVEGDLINILRRNFLIAALWFGIGLSYFFISYFFQWSEKFITSNSLYQLIIYLCLIIAPLVYILGQTVPITMNLSSAKSSTGKIGGNTLGLSTVGSFFGATLTALILMQYLGVAWTVLTNVIILLLLSMLLISTKQKLFRYIFVSAFFIWFLYGLNVIIEKSNFLLTTQYANYQLIEAPKFNLKTDEKIFSINNSFSSLIDKDKKGFAYLELIKKILFVDLNLQNASILVLGAGGFSFSAENIHHNQITFVDIDHVERAAIPKFIDHINGHFIIDDARHFIRTTTQKYDAIVVDVYSNTKSIPAHLITYEFMNEIKAKLNPQGVTLFNVLAHPILADFYSKRVDNTIRAAFQNCMSTPLTYSSKLTNIVYICQKQSQVNRDIYTDNINRSTTDAFIN